MSEYTIQFNEVGRGKASWSETIRQEPTEAIMVRLIKRKKVLMSTAVYVEFDGEYGCILAGFRMVGSLKVSPSLNGSEKQGD